MLPVGKLYSTIILSKFALCTISHLLKLLERGFLLRNGSRLLDSMPMLGLLSNRVQASALSEADLGLVSCVMGFLNVGTLPDILVL